MTIELTRRQALATGISAAGIFPFMTAGAGEINHDLIVRHDAHVEKVLRQQVVDPASRWQGAIPDRYELYHAGSASAFLREGAAAYLQKQSRYYQDETLFQRLTMAAGFLERTQSADGNTDLLVTNFNSPPDTGFVVHKVGTAAKLAKMYKDKALFKVMKEFLQRAGDGLTEGGIHTPNHRWVVCAALAQIHDVLPERRYVKRIDAWLREGIDIDAEGQYIERSTSGYNAVVNKSLVTVAHILKRPALLDPVRQNLDAMMYLLHANGEVVTGISRRQDLNQIGTLRSYWFALRYMAIHDQNGQYAAMLKPLEPEQMQLPILMAYPELNQALPALKKLPDDFEKQYPLSKVVRIRRGKTSATIMQKDNSRWISIYHGDAVINAVRFASAFFGKGQFEPDVFEVREGGYYFRQKLQGQYYQPLTDESLFPVERKEWSSLRNRREKTEICRLVYEGFIAETPTGFEITISAEGTDNVPLSVEVSLRPGGKLTGVQPAPAGSDSFLLRKGFATYEVGPDVIQMGPGHCEHAYTQVRGAQGKLSGQSVYLTGYTPFKHTLKIILR